MSFISCQTTPFNFSYLTEHGSYLTKHCSYLTYHVSYLINSYVTYHASYLTNLTRSFGLLFRVLEYAHFTLSYGLFPLLFNGVVHNLFHVDTKPMSFRQLISKAM